MQWRLGGLTVLHWQHLDGDWAVYDDGSGLTMAVDPVVAAALMALESGCTTPETIEAQVRADLQAGADPDLGPQIAEGLAFLAELGLVEAAPA